MTVPAPPHETTPSADALTARQQQILLLLQKGKGNKEIASELGIHVGTVKQHVVALFKKLNVRNRTMAVALSSSLADPAASLPVTGPADLSAHTTAAVQATMPAASSLLEKRPCVILSLSIGPRDEQAPLPDGLSIDARQQGARRLHATLAAQAYDHDAILLARRGSAAEIIFGVQRTGEHDLLHALRSAQAVVSDLAQTVPAAAAFLHAGLTAGLAVASMRPQGGWTGEAIASAGFSTARTLSDQAPAGHLQFDESARTLMQSVGIGLSGGLLPVQNILPLDELHHLHAHDRQPDGPLRGRSLELSTLYTLLERAQRFGGALALVSGEAGMGKSHLCRAFSERCRKDGLQVIRWRCQPADTSHDSPPSALLLCDDDPRPHRLDDLLAALKAPDTPAVVIPAVVIIDDLHWLPPSLQTRLFEAVTLRLAAPAAPGLLIILAQRRLRPAQRAQLPADGPMVATISLHRLPQDTIAHLTADRLHSLPASSPACQQIARQAHGVPLFAVELARQSGHLPPASGSVRSLPLSLLSLVSARLDHLGLNRRLLWAVAHHRSALTAKNLTAILHLSLPETESAIERAILSGVLAAGPDGTLAFNHPLLRAVIEYLALDKPLS
ncbi:helix-turn-helix domain-containing protein [Insolitispirillum peregrinum]|uniref:AAA ATPase domain-containing protein n=1 Tax=Insolitispirillum peregrinum TaxID=80876 RepID=A0A1N7PD46_9PROT|nr:helix-turn-helix transcriptional regulator [Insolitispirillum peregrinum]SIT08450.1 AAA ATPase domain-containing protein [Insolitispirillum peregrinum]